MLSRNERTEMPVPVFPKENCFLCGGRGNLLYTDLVDARYSIGGRWTYRWCRLCRVAWLDPQPAADRVGELYPRNYETHDLEPVRRSVLLSYRLRRRVKRALLTGFGYRETRVSRLEAAVAGIFLTIRPVRELVGCSVMWLHGERRGRLLDVGCGNGWFLSKMRDLGWEVSGVEPDTVAAQAARGVRGLQVYTGTLQDAKLEGDSFDAVTLHHVFEHIPDPQLFLEECYRVLKPAGVLVIVTPNIDSIAFQRFGPHCWHLEHPRHLYLYSSLSLQRCVETAGFRTVECITMARTAKDVFILSELIRRNGGSVPEHRSASLALRLRGLVFAMREHLSLAFGIRSGEEILLVAEKWQHVGSAGHGG